MINNITIEICIGNLDDAIIANRYPIDRIELNSALELGGCSPSLETLKYLKAHIDKKICCMVRPRGGDFFYSQNEYETMLKDAKNFLEAGADGIVFGFLHEDCSIDLDRTKVYIANMVKCRPPRNRDPQPTEQEACRRWLDRQIALVDPKIIVCLGRIAAMGIIKEDFRITREHGQWFDVGARRVMATYHPSALLRDVSKRPEAFMDLRALRKEIREICTRTY